MKIAVTGATGRVGPHIVAALEAQGHDVVEIARANGVDVITGDGLAEALAGADVIVDAATGPDSDYDKAKAFFEISVANLHKHGTDAKRIVLLSIIGIERYSGGYNAAKLAQERAHLAGPFEVKILRAAQFHEFVEQMLAWGTQNGTGNVPEMRTQLVAAKAVGEAAAALVSGDVPERSEIAGPREEQLVEAARLLAAKRGTPASVRSFTDPSDPDLVAFRDGAALPGPGATLAGPTFEEWLRAQ